MLSNVDTETKHTDYENATTSTEVCIIGTLYCALVPSLLFYFTKEDACKRKCINPFTGVL
jgi:hypothetical protein